MLRPPSAGGRERRLLLAAACGVLGPLLQGCTKPPECTQEGFNCMKTGCCVNPDLKCYVRDDYWARCKASCDVSYSSSCELVHPDGSRTKAVLAPTPAPPTPPTPAPVPPMSEGDVEWRTATWTTGYWDCCKPSCAWGGKGKTDFPVKSCDASTGAKLDDPNEKSICKGGTAVTCADNQPFKVHSNLSMGFVAAAVSGKHGLVGDDNCGQCFELLFTDDQHVDKATGDLWGGSSPRLEGRRMVVQVSNIGYDVKGNHSFDILIPGAGQGAFDQGCKGQFPEREIDDFDCGKRYGGCSDKANCTRLPPELRDGCEWRFDWYRWLAKGGQTNNPYVKFRRVQCPEKLVLISGAKPSDDANFPTAVESSGFYFYS